jgi:hypothetical protein
VTIGFLADAVGAGVEAGAEGVADGEPPGDADAVPACPPASLRFPQPPAITNAAINNKRMENFSLLCIIG